EAPGTLSVVDTGACNTSATAGCAATWPVVGTGLGPGDVLIDPSSHNVFTVNAADATVTVIDRAACSATHPSGCGKRFPRVPIGSIPLDLDLDPLHHTVYTANAPDRSVSVIDARRPCHEPVRCLR